MIAIAEQEASITQSQDCRPEDHRPATNATDSSDPLKNSLFLI